MYVGEPLYGEPIIAHCSLRNGCVKAEPLNQFAGGAKVSVEKQATKFSNIEIWQRSQARLNQGYCPLTYNCEHFVSDLLGLNKGSPQLQGFVIGALFLFILSR